MGDLCSIFDDVMSVRSDVSAVPSRMGEERSRTDSGSIDLNGQLSMQLPMFPSFFVIYLDTISCSMIYVFTNCNNMLQSENITIFVLFCSSFHTKIKIRIQKHI